MPVGPEPQLSLDQWRFWWRHNGERELRDLLLVWWDPIRVYGLPDASDEYDGYVPQLGQLLRDGAREPDVVAYLQRIEAEEITLAGDAGLAAQRVVEWHDRVLNRIDRWGPAGPA